MQHSCSVSANDFDDGPAHLDQHSTLRIGVNVAEHPTRLIKGRSHANHLAIEQRHALPRLESLTAPFKTVANRICDLLILFSFGHHRLS